MFWSMIPMLASMGAGAGAAEQGRISTVEGAESQTRIEAKSREYAQKIFDEDIERQRPFYEAGLKAGVSYGDAVRNKLDPTKSGAYQAQKKLIDEGLADAPEYVKENAYEQLGAVEGEKQKSRLMDLQQIGLGASASAGTASLNLGNMLAQSYGISGNVQAGGMQSGANQKQSMWNTAASQMSGLPSYFASNRQQQPTQPGYQGGMSSYTLNQGIR